MRGYIEKLLNRGEMHVVEWNVTWRDGAYFHGLLCGYTEDLRALEVSFATRVYKSISAGLPGYTPAGWG